MTPNRIMRGGGGRRILSVLAVGAVLAAALGACGGGGSTTAVTDKAGDAAILNEILGRQEAAVVAYEHSLRGLGEPQLALAREFRAQEQEHADAILKALRGLGESAEPPEETIEAEGLKSEADYLGFLYEVESATIEAELSAIGKLTAPTPRTLLTATVANQAQHLVLLRRALGAGPRESVPEPFETGTTPAP